MNPKLLNAVLIAIFIVPLAVICAAYWVTCRLERRARR
jgi:hypothetical protein